LLAQLQELPDSTPIVEAWATVLGVPSEDVSRHMSDVARLVWELDRVLSVPGRERVAAPIARYKPQLLEAAFPLSHGFDTQLVGIKPSAEAYDSLGLVAEYLATAASEGEIPSEEERKNLLDKLQEVIDDVLASDEVPADVSGLILDRLRSVRDALESLRIGGPGAVRLATEALMGAAVAASVPDERTRNSNVIRRVMTVAAAVYVVFTAGPAVQQSIEAWPQVVQELVAGTQQTPPADQPEPPPGQPAPPPDEPR
jgi:hypothetical protein